MPPPLVSGRPKAAARSSRSQATVLPRPPPTLRTSTSVSSVLSTLPLPKTGISLVFTLNPAPLPLPLAPAHLDHLSRPSPLSHPSRPLSLPLLPLASPLNLLSLPPPPRQLALNRPSTASAAALDTPALRSANPHPPASLSLLLTTPRFAYFSSKKAIHSPVLFSVLVSMSH